MIKPCTGASESVCIAVLCSVAFAPSRGSVPRWPALSRSRSCFGPRGWGRALAAADTMASMSDPINTIEAMRSVGWDDRIGLQSKLSNADKGWKVAVEWRQTAFGAGLFAAEDIAPETVLRVGKNGLNLMQFRSVDDIEAFCTANDGSGAAPSDADYRSRVGYVKDYLWGFNPNADERGYETAGKEQIAPRFFGMWVPGNGLNHRPAPNTVYRAAQGGTDEGINLVSLTAIKQGDELFDDYRRHGMAPQWLKAWQAQHAVSLNFADCNDFVQ